MKPLLNLPWRRRQPASVMPPVVAREAASLRTRSGAAAAAPAQEASVPAGETTPTNTHANLPWRVLRSLAGRLGLDANQERYCPVELLDGSVAILTLEDWCDSDQVRELERLLRERGYRLAHPTKLKVTAPLLLAVVRGQLLTEGQASASTAASSRSRMADAFLDMVAWGFEHEASDLHINIQLRAAESEVRYSIAGRYV